MNVNAILVALIIIGIIGLVVGLFLGVGGILFKVEVNEKEQKILEALPGNNCGGCGFPGCAGLAEAISKNEAQVNQCVVGGESVSLKIAEIMGTEASKGERKTAFVACDGHCDDVGVDYDYYGMEDCRMLGVVSGGSFRSCKQGCLGFGTCVKVCQFDAIKVVDGVAKVDRDKCKACGKCVEACPKHLISLIPYDAKVFVACSNTQKGALTTKQCKKGCIGCGICTKNCQNDAITVNNNLAKVDYDKCVACGACVEKCPRKIIKQLS